MIFHCASEEEMMESIQARQRWMSLLAHSHADQLRGYWQPLKLHPEYEIVRAPEIGLTQIQGRMGGTGNRFILGDATVTRAVIRLSDGTCGYSYLLGRDRDHAELCALLDGLLQQPGINELIQRQVITPLAALQQEKRQMRTQAIAASRVDFFTLVRGED